MYAFVHVYITYGVISRDKKRFGKLNFSKTSSQKDVKIFTSNLTKTGDTCLTFFSLLPE